MIKVNHEIQISHETPMCMLEQSRCFNDYDYALVHHFEEYPEYFDFFKHSLDNSHRKVILDNSLYELGKAFDPEQYLKWINKLKPTYYIVPDTFWDMDTTIQQAREWFEVYAPLIDISVGSRVPLPICVAQGRTIDEIKSCYDELHDMSVEYIAFTFKFAPEMAESLGLNRCGDINDATWQSIIRMTMLAHMDGFVDRNCKHHLLGMQNTFGLSSFKGYDWITSMDTSNPICCGLEGIKYDVFAGWLGEKPKTTIDSVFDKYISNKQIQHDIKHNIDIFSKILQGK